MRYWKRILLCLSLSLAWSFCAYAATEIGLNLDWEYADLSKINTGKAVLYTSEVKEAKGITVAVNAGHGTRGGESVSTFCHPDGSPKLTGGTTRAGATMAVAVSSGMTFEDGTPERTVTLKMAKLFADELLRRGYDVLMLRDGEDVQLDNVARTVLANNKADCHIALHWDSTNRDKGAFFMSVPRGLRSMEPVSEYWEKHEKLGNSLLDGLRAHQLKIFGKGSMPMDLTQTSYSTVPSVDIELGDKRSSHSDASLKKLAAALSDGVDQYYGFE